MTAWIHRAPIVALLILISAPPAAATFTGSDLRRTAESDFDVDGRVGFSDFLLFAAAFGHRSGQADYKANYDLTDDGLVGFDDFLAFAGTFRNTPIDGMTVTAAAWVLLEDPDAEDDDTAAALAVLDAYEDGITMFNFEDGFQTDGIDARDVVVDLVENASGQGLRIASGHAIEWPGITLLPPGGRWDATGHAGVAMTVTNAGSNRVSVALRIDNPGGDGSNNSLTAIESIDPGQTRSVNVDFSDTPWIFSAPVEVVGMRGAPGNLKLDPSFLTQMIVFVPRPTEDHQFVIDNIRAVGSLETVDSSTFFPFIDEFGQYIHGDWPGKLQDTSDFGRFQEAEAQDLATHPGPTDWSTYGGWTSGPQLEPTGYFRPEKVDGQWWLVDPEGRLFWSHGIDVVGASNVTGVADREQYFKDLPQAGTALAEYFGQGWWAPRGFYESRIPFTTFSHHFANLHRKYGQSWESEHADMVHRRLNSWGMNTIGNWSDSDIYLQNRTPYLATVGINGPELQGSEGWWRKFHDVFDPGFRTTVREAFAAQSTEAADPWCIGFFVDNELTWGDDVSLALATLASPASQPAKVIFVDDLQVKYATIEDLNTAWSTSHTSWTALLQSTTPPDSQLAREDLVAFYAKTADTYFRTIDEELKALDPNQLYLGCRFGSVAINALAAAAAAEHCDVVSYNRYAYDLDDLVIADGADAPVIIGEFHFGALDRGLFHTGLRAARDQDHRADLYVRYVESALRQPRIVGAHWFQYADEPTAGRGDEENYQIGFVDVCDTPYPETVAASRDIGYRLYDTRSSLSETP